MCKWFLNESRTCSIGSGGDQDLLLVFGPVPGVVARWPQHVNVPVVVATEQDPLPVPPDDVI